MKPLPLNSIARLAGADDNCAIAVRRLEAETAVSHPHTFTLSHTILEGHRFAIKPIKKGEYLTSWGFPFGQTIVDIQPGDYICNDAMLTELGSRQLDFALPEQPNFVDQIPEFQGKATEFEPTSPLPVDPHQQTFLGFERKNGRGVGTRNFIVLLGTSSMSSGFVQVLEKRLKQSLALGENIDGIVGVTHTEGDSASANNDALFIRTMAGFVVHPNVGAVLIVDDGNGNNGRLAQFMADNAYPLDGVLHRFLSMSDAIGTDLDEATAVIQSWLPELQQQNRTQQPLSKLKIALQCGGSDAFSGISGNPLASWVARALIQQGGSANLAETDELVGAEAYVLDKVRNLDTAVSFLNTVERFKKWAERHGESVRGNPSGGNLYRGLYNIYLKSLGAAAKRHPDVPLEHVLAYGEPMTQVGFHFMDSPGNDLESIAGQVASGCNLIFFVTGNGSITNFPFVPTIKIVTTTPRFTMLQKDMDVNAGNYLDGMPMDELGQKTVDLMTAVSSGQATAGEKAGHAQVQLWRDWPLGEGSRSAGQRVSRSAGQQVSRSARQQLSKSATQQVSRSANQQVSNSAIQQISQSPNLPISQLPNYPITQSPNYPITNLQSLNLILPTSLCSGQIARLCADQFNNVAYGKAQGISQTVALPHTEGCGSATVDEFLDTVIGYATHPHVRHCLMLEHGCEKTHNAFWRNQFVARGIDPEQFGWASIQLDGGIEAVFGKIKGWFETQLGTKTAVSPHHPRIAVLTNGALDEQTAVSLTTLTQTLLASHCQLVIPANDGLLHEARFLEAVGLQPDISPNLHYAEPPAAAGLHIMARPRTHWLETITGLGATGADLMIAGVKRPLPGHPFLPLLQGSSTATNLDFNFTTDSIDDMLTRIQNTLAGDYTAVATHYQNTAFQITRGALGISL